ncbi:unnamed protein product [Didymodactylos carnosus]|uniref:Amino acid permease/ SLC12A domain-containing protein n=1 Tax=Didymodactylos carnosus TaxID=1234261 RepID=A0A8S2RP13_9BILA|nr:unnamed protein product [Didymodactylos carnosus]CAF4175192.1 unnamed protein product [Didymodactylos carnosus]
MGDIPQFAFDPTTPVKQENFFQRIISSFKRAPANDEGAQEKPTDAAITTVSNDESSLKRTLTARHLQMIAIGGSIGTGLFVGSGSSFSTGGPASVLIGFLMVSVMLYTVVHALGELTVMYPVQGSFTVYSTRFLDPAWGFAMGWNYALSWLIVLPIELSAAAIVVDYWKNSVPVGVWITIFFVLIISINLFGVRGYAEAEFLFASIKVLAIVGFIILAIVIDVGGTPTHHYFGAETWHNPGAFNNGFHGLCTVFVSAAFSFSGTELVGLAAAETANPRKTLPHATKQVFWRMSMFYIISLLLIGFIVPYNNARLLNAGGGNAASASPFVIAIDLGGVKVLPDIFNVVILTAILSAGNASTYASSRTIAALAGVGQAPKICGYIDRKGRPMVSLLVAIIFGFIAYSNLASSGPTVLNWLLAISGLSSFFTWGSICACHIRFRQGWKYHGHMLDEIPFRSGAGVIGSWIGLILNILCLIAQFYVAIWPVGDNVKPSAKAFFNAYLAVPVVILFYAVYKIIYWKTTSIITNGKMDVLSGRRQSDLDEIEKEKNEEMPHKGFFKRIYEFWC